LAPKIRWPKSKKLAAWLIQTGLVANIGIVENIEKRPVAIGMQEFLSPTGPKKITLRLECLHTACTNTIACEWEWPFLITPGYRRAPD
jgi:hypothetical protein